MQIRAIFLLCALIAAAAVDASPARSEGCRSGADTLADERALDAFREGVDENCACSEGGGASARSEYRSCAEDVLAEALADEVIRPECEQAARDLVLGSVCAASGVPCVRNAGRASGRQCRIEDESRCRSRLGGRVPRIGGADPSRVRRIAARLGSASAAEACSDATSCAEVLEWGAGTCIDVRADGPYGRGVHFFDLTKPSAVDPAEERELRVAVWYPAPPDAGPVDEQRRAVVDAPVDLSGGPYPLVLFSHGSCGYAEQSLFLTPYLASHGFVVVAPDHTGNTLFDFPDCSTAAVQAAAFIERPQDMLFVLEHALAESADPGSFLFDAIDPSRIGMMGHSFGGLTTYLVEALEPRIRVAVPLAAAVPGTPALRVPSLTLFGEVDSVVDNDRIRLAYEMAASPKLLVEIGDAGHYAFSDGCFPGPDCDPPVTRTQAEANELVKRWVLPFLQVRLAGDDRFAPFLAPSSSPPGTSATSD
jgi:predicted dienelactone hydrolase